MNKFWSPAFQHIVRWVIICLKACHYAVWHNSRERRWKTQMTLLTDEGFITFERMKSSWAYYRRGILFVITKLDFRFSSLNVQLYNCVTCVGVRYKRQRNYKKYFGIYRFSQSHKKNKCKENEVKSDRFNYANFMRHQFVLIDHWLRISIWNFLPRSLTRADFFPWKFGIYSAGCAVWSFFAFIFATSSGLRKAFRVKKNFKECEKDRN